MKWPLLPFLLLSPALTAQITERISLGNSTESNGPSQSASISKDGRFVAFESLATNLVPNDGNGYQDVFVLDRKSGQTTRVSVRSDGFEANSTCQNPSISADGRYVAFESSASNLVVLDRNSAWDVFVHDRRNGTTVRISVDSNGHEGNGASQNPAISADGKFIAFDSRATNFVGKDFNRKVDVFRHEPETGLTLRASVNSFGFEGNGNSKFPSISGNGRFVAFTSWASDLVPNDTNNDADVVIYNFQNATTKRISISSNGDQGIGNSHSPSISEAGHKIAFASYASNLIRNDTNKLQDIFVHDCSNGETKRVSVSSGGRQPMMECRHPAISADGNFIAFTSKSASLVTFDINGKEDIFFHDLRNRKTQMVSCGPYNGLKGTQANHHCGAPSISGDGQCIAFTSHSDNFVKGDNNAQFDIFLHDRTVGQKTFASQKSFSIGSATAREHPVHLE